MDNERWDAVDRYLNELFAPPDRALTAALAASDAAGLPPHGVTPTQGKLLHLLARIQKAHAILEIGTLGGYSTIWLARALPGTGAMITLEADPQHAAVAEENSACGPFRHRRGAESGRSSCPGREACSDGLALAVVGQPARARESA